MKCKYCHGTGEITTYPLVFSYPCKDCNGTGEVEE